MKKLLKLNPEYLIGIGLIVWLTGGVFFDTSSDIGLGIALLGCSSALLGCVLGFIQRKNEKTNSTITVYSTCEFWTGLWKQC